MIIAMLGQVLGRSAWKYYQEAGVSPIFEEHVLKPFNIFLKSFV